MKRFFKLSALCAALFALVLTSCNKETFVVTFDSNGGSTVTAVKVQEGKTFAKPTDPTKEGFDFAGWYKEIALTTAWDFSKDVVNSDITLYAKWTVGATVLKSVTGLFYTAQYSGVPDNLYSLAFSSSTEPIVEGGYLTGENGIHLVLNIITSDNTGVLPAGTYNVATTLASGTLAGNWYVDVVNANQGDYTEYDIESGDVVVSKSGNTYTLTMTFVNSDGEDVMFRYTGDLDVETYNPYAGEPTTPATFTVNCTSGGGQNYGDYFREDGDNFYFRLADAAGNDVYLDFIATGTGLTSLPTGTYPINNSWDLNTVVSYDAEGMSVVVYNSEPYFLLSGNAVVTADGFTVNAQSAYGSTITVNYTGSLADGASYAPARIAPKALKGKVFGKTLNFKRDFSFKK